ncbi:MAG: hypothetical protein BV458_10465 [Thermoplasmata archaeon M9B2D]|nr:MAG: hypothetical protein BV458_10465 [Thermoplasmata archaeon M9B2D]
MYQKYSSSKLDDREHSSASPGTRFVSEAKYMTGLLMQDATRQMDRVEILNQQKNLVDALESIWHGVQNGSVRVQSLALLRATKNISFPDIEKKLRSPSIDHARVISDLRLLINTFEYIIKPEMS